MSALEIQDNTRLTKEQEAITLQHFKTSAYRFLGQGARAEDLKRAFAEILESKDWLPVFTRLAKEYEKSGDDLVYEESKMVSYLNAATYYHIAEILTFNDTEDKRRAFSSFKSVYLKAAQFFPFPLEQVEVPFGAITLPGYFRRIPAVKKAPVMILLRGVDACREVEIHVISNHFLREGFFTITADLPGQGESRMRGYKMKPDFEKPVGAIVDYLETRPEVDASFIGILGMSFGGYIAPRAAALEKRIKACVSLGGYYSSTEFEPSLTAKLHYFNDMGLTNEGQWRMIQNDYSLERVIGNLDRPLLVVNGSADKVYPISQAIKMHEKAPGPKELKVYPGLGHCVFYEKPEALTEIAQWVRKQLVYG